MSFKKTKIFVGLAIVVAILIVANILFFGIVSKDKTSIPVNQPQITIIQPDIKKNTNKTTDNLTITPTPKPTPKPTPISRAS
jgi:hypothetical protein